MARLDRQQTLVPDAGAVVLVWPQTLRPEAKISLDGLRPSDPPPAPGHPELRALRSGGGDYGRTDQAGQVRLHLPGVGKYWILTMSSAPAGEPADPPRHLLAEVGRIFLLAPDLFGGRDYRWQEELVQGDHVWEVVFP